MKLTSSRFKALSVTAGFSFWFFIISHSLNLFSLEIMITFVIVLFVLTQVFAYKLSKALDVFAVINTKIFLGILFIIVFSIYGILFKILRIDLLRLKKQPDTYWLKMEELKPHRLFKQY